MEPPDFNHGEGVRNFYIKIFKIKVLTKFIKYDIMVL